MAISSRKLILPASKAPQTVAEVVRHHMGQIAELFDTPKFTLVIRSPTLEGDLVFTNDDPGEAVLAIKKMTTPLNQQASIRLDS